MGRVGKFLTISRIKVYTRDKLVIQCGGRERMCWGVMGGGEGGGVLFPLLFLPYYSCKNFSNYILPITVAGSAFDRLESGYSSSRKYNQDEYGKQLNSA
jgi:hypothetical protein